LLRRKTDVLELQARQRAIIDNVWKMLRPGGTILLVTCSIFAQEGEEQAKWLEAQMNNALRLESPGQIIPGPMNDGFFYALFEKKNAIQRTAQNAVSI
jgi:16S rRNA (cytosine967-C5)-methyltransferase